ncbi:MAG: rod shape-determining protein RodA [Planctomycetes bacterium]|nr:rod shape-determining protein RodA [Planctomycetota bacterium]
MKTKEYIQHFDWHLLFVALVLTILGISFIWSAAQGSDFLKQKPLRQAMFLMVCLPAMGGILKIGYVAVSRYAYFLYGLLLLMLVLVLLMGRGGAARWFDLGLGLRLQPSEFVKLGVILALSRYLIYTRDLQTWAGLIPPFALVLVPVVLIIKQPDLGTALVLLPMVFGLCFAAGASAKKLLFLIFLGIAALPCLYYLPVLKDYQRERITSFLQSIPQLDRQVMELKKAGKDYEALQVKARIQQLKRGAGFQQFHAMASIGSGGLTGYGLGAGPQNRLGTVPERHTDFIFAIVGEEWGLLGSSVMLLLFFILTGLILGVAARTRDPFGRYVCTGVAILFITQAFVNTGISVGLLPITGLTLPFVSYGGSSLLTSYLALGLVLDIGVRRVRVLAALS